MGEKSWFVIYQDGEYIRVISKAFDEKDDAYEYYKKTLPCEPGCIHVAETIYG